MPLSVNIINYEIESLRAWNKKKWSNVAMLNFVQHPFVDI